MNEKMIYNLLRKIALNDIEFKAIAFIFDFVINFDIVDGHFVMTFNKTFFKTFKNNILMNKNDILKIKNDNAFEFKKHYFSYEIKESILYDSNNIHITLLDSDSLNECIESLNVFCTMLYSNYNYKGLNFNDKKLLFKIGGHMKCIPNISDNDILIKIESEKNYYQNDLIIDSKGNDSVIAYDSYIIDKYNSKEYHYNSYRYFSTYDNIIDYQNLMKSLFMKFHKYCLKNKNFKIVLFKNRFYIYFKRNQNSNAIFSIGYTDSNIDIEIYSKALKKYNAFELLELYLNVDLLKEINKIEKIQFNIH